MGYKAANRCGWHFQLHGAGQEQYKAAVFPLHRHQHWQEVFLIPPPCFPTAWAILSLFLDNAESFWLSTWPFCHCFILSPLISETPISVKDINFKVYLLKNSNFTLLVLASGANLALRRFLFGFSTVIGTIYEVMKQTKKSLNKLCLEDNLMEDNLLKSYNLLCSL